MPNITENSTSRNLNAGDLDYSDGKSVLLDAGDNEILTGGAVKFDAEGYITHTEGPDDDFIGVVLPESDQKADNKYTVNIAGLVVAVALDDDELTDVSPGDTLVPSAETVGAFTGEEGGMVANTGDADTPLYLNHPFALESGTTGEVILAVFR